MKKLSNEKKKKIAGILDWEGGIQGAVEHGGIMDLVKDTKLEKPFKKFEQTLNDLNVAIESQGIWESIIEE